MEHFCTVFHADVSLLLLSNSWCNHFQAKLENMMGGGIKVRNRWALQQENWNLWQQLEHFCHIGCCIWPLLTPFLRKKEDGRRKVKGNQSEVSCFETAKIPFRHLCLLRAWGCIQPFPGLMSFHSFLCPCCFCCLCGSCSKGIQTWI